MPQVTFVGVLKFQLCVCLFQVRGLYDTLSTIWAVSVSPNITSSSEMSHESYWSPSIYQNCFTMQLMIFSSSSLFLLDLFYYPLFSDHFYNTRRPIFPHGAIAHFSPLSWRLLRDFLYWFLCSLVSLFYDHIHPLWLKGLYCLFCVRFSFQVFCSIHYTSGDGLL